MIVASSEALVELVILDVRTDPIVDLRTVWPLLKFIRNWAVRCVLMTGSWCRIGRHPADDTNPSAGNHAADIRRSAS